MPNPFANGDQQPYQPQDPYQERQPYADPTAQDDSGYPVNYTPPKSKAAAALLAFFLGSLSVHNFYLGYTAKATTQLVLFLAGCFFFWPIVPILFLIVVPIWAFVEFIMILVGDGWYRADANGVPLAS